MGIEVVNGSVSTFVAGSLYAFGLEKASLVDIFIQRVLCVSLVEIMVHTINSLSYSFPSTASFVICSMITIFWFARQDSEIKQESECVTSSCTLEENELSLLLETGKPLCSPNRNPETSPCCSPLMILYSPSLEKTKENNQIFQASSKKIVDDLAESFKAIHSLDSDIAKDAFWDMLVTDLGKKRREIAQQQESPEFELFGELKTDRLSTQLAYQYNEYGEVLQKKILRNLPSSNDGTFTMIDKDVEIRIVKETSKGSWSYELDTPLSIIQNKYPTCTSCWTVCVSFIPEESGVPAQIMSYIALPVDSLLDSCTNNKRPFILNELVSNHVKNKIKQCFFDCFNCPITADGKAPKENVAKFRYFFAQASIYSRGSASIGEWIEKAIYKHHRYKFEYNYPLLDCLERPSADLDAFNSFGTTEFKADYCLKAQLELIPKLRPVST